MKGHELLVPVEDLLNTTYKAAISAEWDGEQDKAERLWNEYKRYMSMIEEGILYEPLF